MASPHLAPHAVSEAKWNREAELRILIALRRGDARAAEEFYEMFEPRLLDIAARFDVARTDDDIVFEFLANVTEKLPAEPQFPASLTAYVTAAFTHFLIDRMRTDATREEKEACASLECVSEFSAKCAAGPIDAPESASRRRFVRALLRQLSAEDVELLEYRSKATVAEIAAWKHVTYGAMKVRMFRARARAIAAARALAQSLPPTERADLQRFLRLTGLLSAEPKHD